MYRPDASLRLAGRAKAPVPTRNEMGQPRRLSLYQSGCVTRRMRRTSNAMTIAPITRIQMAEFAIQKLMGLTSRASLAASEVDKPLALSDCRRLDRNIQ